MITRLIPITTADLEALAKIRPVIADASRHPSRDEAMAALDRLLAAPCDAACMCVDCCRSKYDRLTKHMEGGSLTMIPVGKAPDSATVQKVVESLKRLNNEPYGHLVLTPVDRCVGCDGTFASEALKGSLCGNCRNCGHLDMEAVNRRLSDAGLPQREVRNVQRECHHQTYDSACKVDEAPLVAVLRKGVQNGLCGIYGFDRISWERSKPPIRPGMVILASVRGHGHCKLIEDGQFDGRLVDGVICDALDQIARNEQLVIPDRATVMAIL